MRRVALQDSWPDSWKLSHHYDEIELHGAARRSGYAYAYAERRRQTLDMVAKAAAPPATVLDVAAGQGNFTLTLAERGYDVTWNDLRADLADYVKLKHERGAVRYLPGNAFELGVDAQFDIVLITEVIEHVAHPDEFLRNAARMVKPGGHVVMTTPNGGYLLNQLPRFSEHADPSAFESIQFQPNAEGHIFLLHADEVAALAAGAGLTMVEHRVFGNLLTNGHMKTSLLLRVLPSAVVTGIEAAVQQLPFLRRLQTSSVTLFKKPA